MDESHILEQMAAEAGKKRPGVKPIKGITKWAGEGPWGWQGRGWWGMLGPGPAKAGGSSGQTLGQGLGPLPCFAVGLLCDLG